MGFGKSVFKMVARLMYTSPVGKVQQELSKQYLDCRPEARNLLTIENDEMGWGLESSV